MACSVQEGDLLRLIDAVLRAPLPPGHDERILEMRRTVPRAYAPWGEGEDRCVEALRAQGLSLNAVGLILGRQGSAVDAHLRQQGEPLHKTARQVLGAERQQAVSWLLALVVRPEAPQPQEGTLEGWIRRRCPRRGLPWTPTEEHLIRLMRDQPLGWPSVAQQVQRPLGELLSHLKSLQALNNSGQDA